MGRQEFSGTVIIQQSTTLAGQGSYTRLQWSGAGAAEMKVGATALANRSNIFLQADPSNTDKIYIGLDSSVTTTKWFAVLAPGASYTIEIEPSKALKIWAYCNTANNYVGLLEIAN